MTKFMIIALLFVASLSCVANAQSFAPHPASPEDPFSFEDEIARFFETEMETHSIPGISLAIVHNGETLLLEGYGLAETASHTPMTPDTIVRAGSVSKLISSLTVLAFAQENDMDLDAPINASLLGFDIGEAGGRSGTLREYLTHTAGYDDSIAGLHTYDPNQWQSLSDFLTQKHAGPVLEPGRMVSYSSWPLAVLGAMIENLSDQSYPDYVDSHIFSPLGMDSSTFIVEHEEYGVGNFQARGYLTSLNPDVEYGFNYVQLPPGIALRTTARDMSQFLQVMLDPDMSGEASQNLPSLIRLFQTPQVAHYPGVRGRALGPSERFDRGYRALWHDGNGIGFVNRAYWVPELDFGFYISINHALMEPGLQISQAARLPDRFTHFIMEGLFAQGSVTASDIDYPHYLVTEENCAQDISPQFFNGYYRPANFPRQTIGKASALFDGISVEQTEQGLRIGSRVYSQTSPCLWETPEGRSASFSPGTHNGTPILYLGAGAFLKTPIFETPGTQLVLMIALVIVSFLAILGWFVWGNSSSWKLSRTLTFATLAFFPPALMGATLITIFTMDPQNIFLGQFGFVSWVIPLLYASTLATGLLLLRLEFQGSKPPLYRLQYILHGLPLIGVWVMALIWNFSSL